MRIYVLIATMILLSFPGKAQDIEWQPVNDGLWGGSIKKVVLHPNGGLYALTGTGSTGEGRLYRSRDDGFTWTALNTGAPETTIAHLVIFLDGEMVASTFESYLLQSTDLGDTWTRIDSGVRLAAGMAAPSIR